MSGESGFKLRDYQARAVEAVVEAWRTARSCLVVLPTGCGASRGPSRNAGTPRRRAVEDFGLYFTTPKPHLVVEAL